MEMRWWQLVWMRQVAGRWRRVTAALVVLSVLLAAQLLSSHVSHGQQKQGAERDEVSPSLSARVIHTSTPQAGKRKDGRKDTTQNKRINVQGHQKDAVRTKLLDSMDRLETRDLQKLLRLFQSYKNPKSVDKLRMDHALQALKVELLEEVSARRYPDIMGAATRALPLSSLPRPEPIQMVIATTWRSGSTFLEELLSSHPGVYNHYEPLMHFGLKQVRGGGDSAIALKLILDLLSCRYKGHDDYMQSAKKVRELVARNKLVWKACSNADLGDALCYNENFLSQACLLYPWSIMKLVRLRLRTLRPVLQNDLMNVRIIFLVRDPRGVINSRSATVDWCNTSDCNDPAVLCSDMKNDLTAAHAMQKEFPGRLLLLRYEDLAFNPINKTRELLSALDLDFDSHMEEFISSHTTKNYNKPWSTSRDSKTRITYWSSKLGEKRLQEVQVACASVMANFGYLLVNTTKEVTLDKVLGPMPTSVPTH